MDRGEVVRAAQEAGLRLVRFLYCDNGGVIRGKTAGLASLATRLESGIGVTVAMQAMNPLDQLQPVAGMGPAGEIRLIPDPHTFVVLPYAPHSGAMLVDLWRQDGTPWEACPRSFLKRILARAAERRLRFQVAFEPEWSLAVKEGDAYAPLDQSLCFSSVGMASAAPVIDEIVGALEAQGLTVEQYYPELGHGQQELSIRHADALRAADNHILYRETVRSVALRHGLYASFAPKPWPDQAGNGCHIHLSAWEAAGERNLLYDPGDPHGLSRLGYHFIGGVLAHLPGLVGLTAPSFNSYHRLRPQSWSSAYVCYGPDNREAAVRIVSTLRGHEEVSANLEFKPSDSSANPYLALGGLLAAGLDGIARGLEPGEARLVAHDPATLTDDERARRGIERLPATQQAALDGLEQDGVLMEALGPVLARSYVAVRRSEGAAFAAADAAFEHRHYFYKY